MDRQEGNETNSPQTVDNDRNVAKRKVEQIELSDEKYKLLCDFYKDWRIGRIIKLILIVALCFAFKYAFRPALYGLPVAAISLLLMIILSNLISMTQEWQHTSQNTINSFMLPEEMLCCGFLEIFPGKGIRLFKRYRRYRRRQMRNTNKENLNASSNNQNTEKDMEK